MENERNITESNRNVVMDKISVHILVRNFRVSLASASPLADTSINYPFKLVDRHSTP